MSPLTAVIPMWGHRYAKAFAKWCLPTLLAPGNLPALSGVHLEVVLLTTADDRAMVEKHRPGWEREISRFAQLKVMIVAPSINEAPIKGAHAGTLMKTMFQNGFDHAIKNGRGFVPICCDAVYSDDFFANALKIIRSGKRAAMTQGSGMRIDHITPFMDAHRGPDGVIAIPPRKFMAEFLRCSRYGETLPTWPGTKVYPAQIFWPVGQHGVLMRCAHMYTAIIYPNRYAVMQFSHDNDLAERVLMTPEDIGWMDNSDQGFFFGLVDKGHASEFAADHPTDTPSLVAFCRTWLSPWKCVYLRKSIRWHDGEPVDWAPSEAAATKVIGDLTWIYQNARLP